MIEQILSHGYAAVSLLALIIFIDIAINFKKPITLKVFLLILAFSIFMLNVVRLFELHYFLAEVARTSIMIAGINTISLLLSHKLKKDIAYLSLFLFLFIIFLLLGNYYSEIHNNLIVIWSVRFFRIVALIISAYLFLKLYKSLFQSLNENTFYSLKIKKWTRLTILFFTVGVVNNFASIFWESGVNVFRSVALIIHLSLCIFLIYRPSFLNRTELSLTLGKAFRKKTEDDVNVEDFIAEFYTKAYFLNKNANIDEFSKKINIAPQLVNAYIFESTNLNFSDLVNKSRVDYFVTLIKSQEYKDYTIDALSELTGFGTRQTLYRNFKKFHGGNPSDLLRSME